GDGGPVINAEPLAPARQSSGQHDGGRHFYGGPPVTGGGGRQF
ncbi:hypothetical protein A2U01_0102718, partial [Trifolium medium]|nr:hypothetical protein [Trifolium medium]